MANTWKVQRLISKVIDHLDDHTRQVNQSVDSPLYDDESRKRNAYSHAAKVSGFFEGVRLTIKSERTANMVQYDPIVLKAHERFLAAVSRAVRPLDTVASVE